MPKPKYMIVAVDSENGIGKDKDLPWNLRSELQYFKKRTLETSDPAKKNAVIMGRTTWESIPEDKRPLPGRKNIVLTTNPSYSAPGATITSSLPSAYIEAEADPTIENIFVIGGAIVFNEALADIDGIYLTRIKGNFDCDTFFPEIPEYFEEAKVLGEGEEDGIEFDYMLYLNRDND